MRNKRHLLPLAAMAVALSAATGYGQSNVYSLNVVGYYNLSLSSGFHAVANQLVTTNLSANYVLPVMPDGSLLYRFDPVQQKYSDAAIYYTNAGWYPVSGDTNDPALNLPMGEGFILWSPQPWTNTLVGEVLQGTLVNPIPANWSLRNSMVPQAGLVQTDLSFPSQPGDQIVQLTNQTPWLATFQPDLRAWVPAEPQVAVGESLFVWRDPAYAIPTNDWIRYFVVQRPALPAGLASGAIVGGPPVIAAFSVRAGIATLTVGNAGHGAYAVQFSSDGVAWQTVAANQMSPVWHESFRGGARGYYRLALNP